jgi:hypothetical protein
MKAYGGVKQRLLSVLDSALEDAESSGTLPGHLPPVKQTPVQNKEEDG